MPGIGQSQDNFTITDDVPSRRRHRAWKMRQFLADNSASASRRR